MMPAISNDVMMMHADPTSADVRAMVLHMLAGRASEATVCPSEVARRLAGDGDDWRDLMPRVHAAIDELVAGKMVRLSWKGTILAARAGPYRIGRGAGF